MLKDPGPTGAPRPTKKAALSSVQQARRANLKKLAASDFEGNASRLARKLGSSHTYIWQLTSGYRGMGERTARHIEQVLGLEHQALDKGAATPKIQNAAEVSTAPQIQSAAVMRAELNAIIARLTELVGNIK